MATKKALIANYNYLTQKAQHKAMKDFWDQRYSMQEYIYGEAPNVFFAQQLANNEPGKLLLPAEGEGRNAVYAAQKGWTVDALDYSTAGKRKATQLAAQKGVSINYTIADVLTHTYYTNYYDLVALVYTHFPKAQQPLLLDKMIAALRPGGQLIMEVFHHTQIGNPSGGPQTTELLYTESELKGHFDQLGVRVVLLEHVPTILAEGAYHKGPAEVVRAVVNKQ